MGFYGICAPNFPTKQGIIGRIRQFQEAKVLAPLSDFLADFFKRPVVRGSVAPHQNLCILLTLKQAYLYKKTTDWVFCNINSLWNTENMEKKIKDHMYCYHTDTATINMLTCVLCLLSVCGRVHICMHACVPVSMCACACYAFM